MRLEIVLLIMSRFMASALLRRWRLLNSYEIVLAQRNLMTIRLSKGSQGFSTFGLEWTMKASLKLGILSHEKVLAIGSVQLVSHAPDRTL